jgi:hypothetical protein
MAATTSAAVPSPGGEDNIIQKIDGYILKAVNELIRRANADGDGEPQIEDRKERKDGPASGTVQDCEFGLMVLTAREWLKGRGRLEGDLGKPEVVKTLVIALVQKTAERITNYTNVVDFSGGELKGSPVFFSGDPYTAITVLQGTRRREVFSANLDAAMLIIAFLAAALEEFDADLGGIEFNGNEEIVKRGIKTLKNAALLVIKEGLLYASQCRVYEKDQLVGYACDPMRSKAGAVPGSNEENDRLFFSWTTCETIHELSNWAPYLDSIEASDAAPAFIKEMKLLLDGLQQDLKVISDWCLGVFLDRFRNDLQPSQVPEVGRIVIEIGKLGEVQKPSPKQEEDLSDLGKYVTHVYHLSQYAAIRSIEPLNISLGEVSDIISLLDTIVGQILSSGLDAATHPRLFETLTRNYRLGSSNQQLYKDDAYFPLVVRSLSGLLSRTITTLGTVATRDKVTALVLEFRRSLRTRYDNLIERRPEPGMPGDEDLWSYAAGRPFVLYATQRTVFSLLEYAKFVQAMEEWERSSSKPVPIERIELEVRELLAKSFAEVLIGPVIERFIKSAPFLRGTPSLPAPPGDGQGVQLQLPLPEPKWTHLTISSWLADFKAEFDGGQPKIFDVLSLRAGILVEFRGKLQEARRLPTNPKMARIVKIMEGAMDDLLKIRGFSRLEETNDWEKSTIVPVLFDHLFREFVSSPEPLAAKLAAAPLWEIIEKTNKSMDQFDKALETPNSEKGMTL